MTNYQLQYFVSICELCSFTKAADKHFISQPAISQQMAALEKELNTKLFVRWKKGIVITKTGALLLRCAKGIVEQLESVEKDIRLIGNDFSGFLSIGYGGAPESPFLSNTLRKLRMLFPSLYVRLTREDSSNELIDRIKDGTLDAAFVMCERREYPGILIQRLLHYPVCLVVGPDHPLYERQTVTADEVFGNRVIRPPLDRDQRKPSMLPDTVSASFPDRAMLPEDISEIADHIDTVFHLVEAGYGVAQFPQYFQHYVNTRHSSLRFIPIESDPGNDRDLAFAALNSNSNPIISALMEVIMEELPKEFMYKQEK